MRPFCPWGISIIYEGFAFEPKNVTEYGFCHRHSILSHDCVCSTHQCLPPAHVSGEEM